MNKDLQTGKYYSLSNIYVYNGDRWIDVPYTYYGKLFFTTRYYSKRFAEFIKIEEPMLFNHEMQEVFTGISVKSQSLTNVGPNSSEGVKKNGVWEFWINSDKFNFQSHIRPNSFLICNGTSGYPFIHDFWGYDAEIKESYREIKGSELYDLLNNIKDSNSTIQNPTFNRHVRILKNLFENSCKLANLPFKTPEEYYRYINNQQFQKQQKEAEDKAKNSQHDKQVRMILDKYKK